MDLNLNKSEVPLVYCIVLNWNGWKDTFKCLDSLAGQDYQRLKIIAVDNASTDESVIKITEAYPSLRLVETNANLGFAGGNNAGIRLALNEGAEFVWLLNNDTIVPQNTASLLVAKAIREQRAGEIGSVFYHMHEPETIQAWGGATLSPWKLYRPKLVMSPRRFGKNTAMMAASILLRREALMQAGLLDDRFFVDFEDSDLSFRIYKAGWALEVAEDTRILHKGGASFKTNNIQRWRYSIASQIRFIRKHAYYPNVLLWAFCLVIFISRMRRGEWTAFRTVRACLKDAKR